MGNIERYYGLHPKSVESVIIEDFELIAHRKQLHVRAEEADTVRGFATAIVEHVLGSGGAARSEGDGRRYSARERDQNLDAARKHARRIAERATERAKEGRAEVVVEEMLIGSQRIRYRTTSTLFKSLCPPPLPPICFEK